ncbi:hypothetical protein L6V77_05245 [Myxococcota bacterium]|jgi:uncharacterized protein YneF (UPF0154 family)|nr:hypothetical protein [Myxococcota bacterium]
MLRLIGLLVVVGGAFAGGFYVGVKHRNDELVQNPEELLKAYQEALKTHASDKMEKIKKVILED